MMIKTGDFIEYYSFNYDNTEINISIPENFPPLDFRFYLEINKTDGDFIINKTSLNSFYWLKRLCDNHFIGNIVNEYIPSDSMQIWIL